MTFSLPSDLEETMITHRGRRLTTSLWMTCLLCLFLLTLAPVSSAQKPTAADVPALVMKLKDKDEKVRTEAAKYLESLGAEARAAIPALVEAFRDTSGNVRYYAVQALGSVAGDKGNVPTLVNELKDKDPRVRVAAAARLSPLNREAKAAIPALVETLRDPDAQVRYYAVTALSNLWYKAKPGPDVEAAVPLLIGLLKGADVQTRARRLRPLPHRAGGTRRRPSPDRSAGRRRPGRAVLRGHRPRGDRAGQ